MKLGLDHTHIRKVFNEVLNHQIKESVSPQASFCNLSFFNTQALAVHLLSTVLGLQLHIAALLNASFQRAENPQRLL